MEELHMRRVMHLKFVLPNEQTADKKIYFKPI